MRPHTFFATLVAMGLGLLLAVAGLAAETIPSDHAAANYLRAAAIAMQEGDTDRAGAILEESLVNTAPTPDMLTLLADVYRRQGRLEAAADAAERALAMDAGFAPARVQLGDVFVELGWLEAAAEEYRAALAADADLTVARYRLVDCLAAAGRRDAAERECRELMTRDPGAASCLALADQLAGQQRWDEALAACDLAVERDPRCGAALARRASLLGRRGDFQASAEDARRALALNPDCAEAHAALGLAAAHGDDPMTAYSHAVRAEQAGMDMGAVWALLQEPGR